MTGTRHHTVLLIRLVAGVVLTNVLALALAAAYLYTSRSGYERQAQTTAENLARALEINYAGRLDKINVALFALAGEAERQLAAGARQPAAMNAFMARHVRATPELDGIWVSDQDGWIHEGTRMTAGKPIDIRDREYFRRHVQEHPDGMVLSKPVMGRVTKAWSILMSRRISHPDGSFGGIALGSLPFVQEFNHIFSTLDVGPGGVLNLRGEDLSVIVRYPMRELPGAQVGATDVSPTARAAVARQPAGGSFRAVSAVDNKERFFAYRKVGAYPWYVFVGISIDDTLQPWRRELWLLAAVLLAVLLSSILYARNLMQRTEESFAIELMEKRNESLEGLVQERTAQLEVEKLAAESANRAKSTFLANMSHELRTPLNAVIGFSQMMGKSATMAEEEKANLGIILRSGQHLLILINDILELSKIEAGRAGLNTTSVELARLLHEVVDMISIGARHAGLALRLDCGTLPATVQVDGVKLRQVLLNLMANAVKFTEQGTVTLAVRATPLEGNRSALRFAVRDSGVGIRQEDLARIFEPFIQSDNAVAKVGTGLGLAISRDFVAMMGGVLEVDSAPGAGSTFHFTLALETGEAEAVVGPLAAGEEPGSAQARAPVDETRLKAALAQLPQAQRAALRMDLQVLDLKSVQAALDTIGADHPALVAMIDALLRQHRYPQLCALLDQVQEEMS